MTARKLRKSLQMFAARVAGLGVAVVALLVAATPAGAVVVEIGGRTFGVTPANSTPGTAFARAHAVRTFSPHRFDEGPRGGTPLLYHGGAVMHSTETHVIYWDPAKEFSVTTKGIIEKFFTDVAHDSGQGSNVFGVNGQFTDGSGNAAYASKFGGAVADADSYPASGCTAPSINADPGPPYTHCFTDEQLRSELSSFIAAKALPKGPTQFYALLLPHKVATCFNNKTNTCSNNVFCAYHSSIEPGSSTEILYADIPFSLLDEEETFGPAPNAKGCQDDGHPNNIQQPNPDNGKGENSETRFADVALKYTSHEFSETATDPLGNAWFDEFGQEDGDKCNGVTPIPGEEGVGSDKNSFAPILGGKFEEGNLFNQSINGNNFYIQSEWDNVAKACRMTPLAITSPTFTSSPATPAEFIPVKFKAAATDPYGHDEFKWDFGDKSAEGTGVEPEHTYLSEGKYTVTMTAKDANTDSTATPVKHTITVDELPLAFFSISPTIVTVKGLAEFDGKESEDPDGTIASYKWDFGDGEKGTGEKVTHKYKEPGEYDVTLTVEDSSGLTAEESESLTVIDQPTVKTEPASGVGQTTATLNARVTPNGAFVSECKLEYGKTEAYGSEAPCSPSPGSEFEPVAVSAAISGLEPGTEYHYRVVAKNEVPEQSKGADKTFTTLAKLPPAIAGETAGSITQTTASIGGTVNPNGLAVEECRFEYGTSVFYEASAPCAALPGSGSSPVAVAASIGGLTANTTYHYRLVAKSAAGKGEGADATFKTAEEAVKPPPPPPPGNSSFIAKAGANPKTGVITVFVSVVNPGTFSWLATFANGKFGVFSSSACKAGFIKLAGKCKPAKITFAKGSGSIPAAGAFTFLIKPSASAKKALAKALKRKKGVVVTLTFSFQSSLGGSPASASLSLTDKLKKKK